MRIYAVADIHARRDRIKTIEYNVKTLRPDVLVLAGDIASYFRSKEPIERLGKMATKVLAVRGNSDLRKVEKKFARKGIQFLHLTTVEIEGMKFTGISGAIPIPLWTKFRWIEGEIERKMEDLVDENTILVTHPPPRGLRDEVGGRFRAGSRLLRRIVNKYGPRIVICGHIHERTGTALEGDTLVVNCSMGRNGAGAIIELERSGDAGVWILD